MFRPIAVLVALTLILGLVLPKASRADEPTIPLGEKHEGEIGGKIKPTPGVGFNGVGVGLTGQGFQADLTVKLKAGEAVLISAKVKGDNRKV